MSRRKQAKPRALKREDEEEEKAETACVDNPQDLLKLEDYEAFQATGEGSAVVMAASPNKVNDVTMVAGDEGEEPYTCESCSTTFYSLHVFMDHKNSVCITGTCIDRSPYSETSGSNSPVMSPHDVDGSKSPTNAGEACLGIPEDQLPYTLGVTETTPYACQFCDKAFGRLSHLKKHEQVHGDQMPYRCDFCQRLFKHKRSRDRHVKLHTGDKKYKCLHCDSAFSRSDHLKIHMKTHDTAKPYQCVECNRGYTTPAALTSHMISHIKTSQSEDGFTVDEEHLQNNKDHDKVAEILHCSRCKDSFATWNDLERHLIKAHSEKSPDKHVCPVCKEAFDSSDALCTHIKGHAVMTSPSISDDAPSSKRPRLTPKSVNLSVTEKSGGDNACPYCSKKYPSLEVLEIHIHTMHEGKPTLIYDCHYCGAVFPSSYVLNEHIQLSHDGRTTPIFPCEFCTMDFTGSEALEYHMNNVHNFLPDNSESAFCSQCNAGFPNSATLADHVQKIHSGGSSLKVPDISKYVHQKGSKSGGKSSRKDKNSDRFDDTSRASTGTHPNASRSPTNSNNATASADALICDQCLSSFDTFDAYASHMQTHLDKGSQGGHLHICHQCGSDFTSEDQLEAHSLSHYLNLTTEFGCTSCLKLFSKPDELQKHLMDIHAHHLYRCSLCKETFDSKVNVQVHFAIKHSNECKLYQCTACTTIFRSEMEWQLHVKVNHLHITKPYRCLFCKDSFSAELDLQMHLTSHKKEFMCPACNEAFHVEFLLDKHIQDKHADSTSSAAPTPQLASPVAPPPPQTPTPKLKENSNSNSDVIDLSSSVMALPSPQLVQQLHQQLSLSNHQHHHQGGQGHRSRSSNRMREIYQCELCDAKFSNDLSFQNHYVYKHSLKAPMEKYQKGASVSSAGSMATSVSSSQNSLVPSEKYSHRCVYCNQTFKTKSELEKHTKTHGTSSSHKCKVCDEVFPSVNILAEHKLSHCKVGQANTCAVCRLMLRNEEHFYSHTQSHGVKGGSTQCIVCRQTLTSVVELQMHARHHFRETLATFTCCVCLKSYDSKENLITKVNSSGREYYVCKMCYHGNGAGSPQPTHYTCRVCLKIFSNTDNMVSKLNASGKEYHICKQCYHGNQDVDPCKMSPQFYTCCACLKTYETKDSLVSRLNSSGREYFVCNLCYYGNQKAEVKKEHRCPVCSVKFESQALLDVHATVHNKKTYQCIKCQQSFATEYEIQVHVATHMMQEGTILDCRLCGRAFESPAKLQCHLIEHSYEPGWYHCYICERTFDQAVDIQNHVLEHENSLRKFACTQCSQSFFFSGELQNHLYTHAKELKSPSSGQGRRSRSGVRADEGSSPVSGRQGLIAYQSSSSPSEGVGSGGLVGKMDGERGVAGNTQDTQDQETERDTFQVTGYENLQHVLLAPPSQQQKAVAAEFHCPDCNKTFLDVGSLSSHIKQHEKREIFKCSLCPQIFPDSLSFQQHFILTHASVTSDKGQGSYNCPDCELDFTSLPLLQAHMRTHSSGKENCKTPSNSDKAAANASAPSKDFSCSVCEKTFSKRNHLKEHMQAHFTKQ
ncbi:zinc finger protein 423-like, partial [Lingula anatina]|uniref:Zinc finger protein 423-like n=1 Tax=Lingula anatina TaxID=7574 RepID=A0A1S3HCI1_LINAN